MSKVYVEYILRARHCETLRNSETKFVERHPKDCKKKQVTRQYHCGFAIVAAAVTPNHREQDVRLFDFYQILSWIIVDISKELVNLNDWETKIQNSQNLSV